jgi:UDP-glucose 4-epimerase
LLEAVIDVGGGSPVSVYDLIGVVHDVSGRPVRGRRRAPRDGDFPATHADLETAKRLLGWRPRVGLREGVASQLAWERERQAALLRDARRGVEAAAGRAVAATG